MMDALQPAKPRGLVVYPENRDFIKKAIPRPAWPMPGRKVLGLNAAILFIMLVVFLLLAFPAWRDWLRMRNDGVIVNGHLLSAEITGARNSIMWAEYEYEYNSQRYTRREKLDAPDYDALVDQQDTLRVRLLPDDPQEANLEDFGSEGDELLIILTILGAICILVALFALIVGLNERDQKQLLIKEGQMVRGEVLSYEANQINDKEIHQDHAARMAGGLLGMALLNLFRRHQTKKTPQSAPTHGKWRSKIRYKFTSPKSSKVIEKTETIIWTEEGDLPLEVAPGTQIAVYYRTDRHFKAV